MFRLLEKWGWTLFQSPFAEQTSTAAKNRKRAGPGVSEHVRVPEAGANSATCSANTPTLKQLNDTQSFIQEHLYAQN